MGAGNISKRMQFVKNKLEGISIGVAVNIAALETSGSGSSILHRDGASTGAGEGMTFVGTKGSVVASGHADGGAVRIPKGFSVPGSFARFREVGGFDTQKNSAVRALQVAGNLAGVAANKSMIVKMQVDLDDPAITHMALQGRVTFNQAIADKL